jgi:TPR repeat protein
MRRSHELSRNQWLVAVVSAGLAFSMQSMLARGADLPQTVKPASVQRETELAAAYLTGRGVMRDEKRAAYWYEKAAEGGDPQAQKQIGYFYQVGLGVPVDPARAVHWYQLAAANGLVSAKVNLGVAYLVGIGVRKNPALGEQLFLEAASKGDGLAACYLGEMYFFGVAVKQDKSEARHWYELGAKEHNPRAAFQLASILYADADRAHNLSKVLDNLRRSSNAGYVPAMHALGYLLANEPSLHGSRAEMLAVLGKASEGGYWKSSAMLGVLARNGAVGPADLKTAYYDFRLATLQGGDPAKQLLAKELPALAAKIDPAETARLDAQAEGYFQRHHEALEFVYKDGEQWNRFPAFALAVPEAGSSAGKLIPTRDLD